jgi:hypothetical protein
MGFEIGQARDAFALRILAADRQRIGVVESERHGDGKPHRRQFAVQLGKRRHGVELQNFLGDRSRVFGINIDIPRRERVQHDRGVAEALLMRRVRLSRGLRRLPNDFAQDVRFGEALRSDIERGAAAEGSAQTSNTMTMGNANPSFGDMLFSRSCAAHAR